MPLTLFSQIAAEELGIDTLTVRQSDRLDFHDVYVGAVLTALQRAYQAGLDAGRTQQEAES